MRILILGGGAFVGRALTEAATSRGHEVTTFTRSTQPPGVSVGLVEAVFGDRTEPSAFDFAQGRQWDVVFDTWWGAPRVVQQSVEVLRRHASCYSYVSSCAVYKADPVPFGIDENFQTVEGDPSGELNNYPADKRGAELAILEGFGFEASLLARPGMILGPYEWPARLPWWLNRIAQGGEVLAPGPHDLALQYIDVRDLAVWMVKCAEKETVGAFNTISVSGHTKMSELLEACKVTTDSDAHFTWVPPDFVLEHGIQPWLEVPIWITPNTYGSYGFDVRRAASEGLFCRPMIETVFDTWTSIQSGNQSYLPDGMTAPGISMEKEQAILAAWADHK